MAADNVPAFTEFRQVQDKYKCAKSRRIFKHTVLATLDSADNDAVAATKEVTITGTMLSLFQDHAFKGLRHLRRGHILEKHEAENYEPLYLEFKAYPKFGNWGEPGYASDLPGPIVLSRKYSGSMIIVCCLPDTLTLTDNSGASPTLTYKHPMGTFYCTSKNGFDNTYSQAAQKLLSASFLDGLRMQHGVTTLVCEIMGLDEHAYVEGRSVDSALEEETTSPYLIVHGLTRVTAGGDSVELSPNQFPDGIAWPESIRPVECLLFDTFDLALAHFQRENSAEPGTPGVDLWAFQGEGYVALGANGERLKFKFWRYLMHREFRVIRDAKACPSVPSLLRRFKIMGCTLDDAGQRWWAGGLQKWFLLHAGETGPFIAAKDAFLASCSKTDPEPWVDEQLQKLPLIIALQGLQCSGKSTLRQRLVPYVHWHGSQDEHGSVAALAQALGAALQAHQHVNKDDRFVALVDRCNKAQNERDNLEAALNKHCPGLFVLEYVRLPDVALEELVQRFATRHGSRDASQDVQPHAFSPTTVGMLRGMEILAQGHRDYMLERNGKSVPGRPWRDELLSEWHMTRVESKQQNPLPIQHPTRNPKPGKVVYSGFGVLLDPEVYGYDVNAQVLRPNSPEATLPISGPVTGSPGKWYGTHVTHTFGPKDPLPEGVAIDIVVTGYYERKSVGTDSISLCGLTVSYTWQDVPCIGHITLFCAPGVGPKESNDALAAAIDGTDQAVSGTPKGVCTRTKLDTPYVLRGFSGTWKR
jgi:hypothetical protein